MQTTTPEFEQLPDLAWVMGVMVIGGLLFYVYFSLMLMILARKTGTPNAWMAWIPVVNLFLMCQIGRKPAWWGVLLLIPVVNIVVGVMVWIGIAEARGKPALAGVLVIVPVVNLLVMAYLAAGAATQPAFAQPGFAPGQSGPASFTPGGFTAGGYAPGPRTCPACGAAVDPGDNFCGVCSNPVPAAPAAPPPMAARAAGGGKLGAGAVVAIVAVVVIVAVIGGVGWFAYRAMSYSPPDRRQPQLPERAAGTLTEFPVDTDPNSPVRPDSVVTQNFSDGGARTSAQKVQTPEKWLPPGVPPQSLPQRADAMTSATYRTGPANKASTTPAAKTDDSVFVHVLNTRPNQPSAGGDIADSVQRATRGERTGVRVNSPDGDLYTGSRIRTPQISVYVLDKENSAIVIIIYAPTPQVAATADRLAQNVGNGEGLNDYPDAQSALWTLPATPPDDLELQEVNTVTAAEMEGSLRQDAGTAGGGAELEQLLAQVRQFIPERLTRARYEDRARRDWNVAVGDYGSSARAWTTWQMLRWTAGVSVMQSVTVPGGDGLYADKDGQAVLIFHKGPYLILVVGPGATPAERLTALAASFQV
jgi:hypothetical protein